MNTLFKTVTSSHSASLKRAPEDDVLDFKSSNVVEAQSIHIHELELEMFIGVLENEKKTPQRVLVTAKLEVAPNHDWQSDKIDNVVSYADIIDLIKALASKDHIELVETFAHQITDACLSYSNEITSVTVTVNKPDIIEGTKSVGCSLKKSRA